MLKNVNRAKLPFTLVSPQITPNRNIIKPVAVLANVSIYLALGVAKPLLK
jgi:hypothetical protein